MRSVFRAQNEGESVRISIPFEAIVDVDGSDASSVSAEWAGEGQDMVSIKVINSVQSQEDFSMDEYFFLNLANPSHFVEQIRNSLIAYAAAQTSSRPKPIVRDSTSSLTSITSQPVSIPKKHRDGTNVVAASGLESQLAEAADYSSTPMPGTAAGQASPSITEAGHSSPLSSSVKTIKSLSLSTYIYPPSPSKGSNASSLIIDRKSALPHWVREASSKLNLSHSDNWFAFRNKSQGRAVQESWSASPYKAQEEGEDVEEEEEEVGERVENEALTSSDSSLFSVLDAPEREGQAIEADAVQQFRECFSLPDAEALLGHREAVHLSALHLLSFLATCLQDDGQDPDDPAKEGSHLHRKEQCFSIWSSRTRHRRSWTRRSLLGVCQYSTSGSKYRLDQHARRERHRWKERRCA
jgi:sterol 3beta-glucosyltransferase